MAESDDAVTRVWANGCFDVFHFGHANFLRQAKATGDYLIAGVHGDADIAANKARPVMCERERIRIVSAVKWVDEVQGNIPYGNVVKTLDENSCRFCAHGDDIARDASGRDIYAEAKEKGRFKECKRTEGISTTMIIDRVLSAGVRGACEPPHAGDGKSRIVREMSDEYYEEKMNEFSCAPSAEPRGDRKIVYSQGVFDLFHSGHVDFLEKCKGSVVADGGDAFVVVGVLSDEEAYRVFGSYPVTNTYERVLALMACKFVDKVEVGVHFELTAEFLDRIKVIGEF